MTDLANDPGSETAAIPVLGMNFDRDELEHLAWLTDLETPPRKSRASLDALVRKHWLVPHRARRNDHAHWLPCCRGESCQVAQHIYREHVYFRHGEVVVRVNMQWLRETPAEVSRAVLEWVDAIHAHEVVCA